MSPTLHPARFNDLHAIHTIRRAAILGIRSPAITKAEQCAWAERRTTEDFEARVGAGEVIVAWEGDRAVGWGSTTADRITGLYVHPSAGSRGIGSMLVEALELRIQGAGHGASNVRASPNAVGFYAGVGYRETGVVDGAGAVRMRKTVFTRDSS